MKKLLLLLLLLALRAHGQTPLLTVTPTGASNCGEYMASRRGNDFESMVRSQTAVVWLWGYLSRYNLESPQAPVQIPTQAETMHLLLEKYCRQNPVGTVVEATFSIIKELGGNPAKSQSKSK